MIAEHVLRNIAIKQSYLYGNVSPDSRKGSPGYLPSCKRPARQNNFLSSAIMVIVYSWRDNPRNQAFDPGRADLSLY